MNQWAFVLAAYLLFLGGTGGLLAWALLTCRRAEQQAEKLSSKR